MLGASEETQYDVVIVGSGPAALTCLSAIQEPYALDELSALQLERALKIKAAATTKAPAKVAVIDPHPTWMHDWKRNFKALDIQYLRSPAIAHPDMFDSNALLAFAQDHGRTDELIESGCGDIRELLPLGQSQIGLWRLPSTQLFLDFCQDLIDRLDHDYLCDKVKSIHQAGQAKEKDENKEYSSHFVVELCGGSSISSKAVVLATGIAGVPLVPKGLEQLQGLTPWFKLDSIFDEKNEEKSTESKSILVVGGGLTAVQVAQKCANHPGNYNTVLCSRRPLIERHFDLPIEWFDHRSSTKCMSDFYHQSMETRFGMLAQTRGGGRVPKIYMQQLLRSETSDSSSDSSDDDSESTAETTQSHIERIVTTQLEGRMNAEGNDHRFLVEINGKQREFDHIVIACGVRAQCEKNPLYQQILSNLGVVNSVAHGYPNVTQDLEWMKNLFVVGGLSGLGTGPDAANLMGMRRAAKVVAQRLGYRQWLREVNVYRNPFEALFPDDSDDSDDDEDGEDSDSDEDEEAQSEPTIEQPLCSLRRELLMLSGSAMQHSVVA